MSHPPDIIVILEDNLDRREIIRGIVESLPGNFELQHFDSVDGLRSLASSGFARVRLITLDFSLDNSSARTPGTGMDAVNFLIKRAPVCPVIVHTSSAGDSRKMAEALAGKGWTVKQVSFGSRDREEKWRAAAMQLMGLTDAKA